ncbi:asparaginase [Pseudoteredinibacter isoporae]|uniref:L-asparaginase n=1 Tax=Pseudoteredinibacter isoporae TaxID=570281 RepID=A0A7X0JWB3_9GAMM|nr:asparaginase [Pseudoteredinibacter isoporae]MBB6522923.1 L-asparaginase [Pseudoteredinibacter isoporae]NHO88449.1 asparaginase [Pseudoteredinibacter isoporae]NIB23220.1 asparaginase [Pseudoteredinibacter isoporae]
MHHTLVIYAGGTIGMAPGPDGLAPNEELESNLRHALASHEQMADFDFLSLRPLIDSSDATPSDWQRLADTISQHRDYQSYIVLHGTDTMAFSAAALSYMFAGSDKAIVFTGSQVPLLLPENDAVDNFIGALRSRDAGYSGVGLYFGGELLPANRCHKASSRDFHAFVNDNGKGQAPNKAFQYTGSISQEQHESVGIIYFYPGISAQAIRQSLATDKLKLVLLLSFGAGNIPAADAALVNELESAKARGICLFNISQCRHGGVQQDCYATGSILSRCGVRHAGDINLEAAFAKAHILLAQGLEGETLGDAMCENLAGEIRSE